MQNIICCASSSSTLRNGTIPVIAMISFAMAVDVDLVLAAECTGYFEKPIDPLTIMDMIHALFCRTGENGDRP